jgi:hypothetical protein
LAQWNVHVKPRLTAMDKRSPKRVVRPVDGPWFKCFKFGMERISTT